MYFDCIKRDVETNTRCVLKRSFSSTVPFVSAFPVGRYNNDTNTDTHTHVWSYKLVIIMCDIS